MAVMEHISATERRIIRRVIANIKELLPVHPDLTVEVRDEEQMEYRGPFDQKKIEEVVGHTGMTRITVNLNPPKGLKAAASVLFIHGNEEDVLSDSGWSNGCEWLERHLCKGAQE